MSKRKAANFECVDVNDTFGTSAKKSNVSPLEDATAAAKKVEMRSKLERLTREIVVLRQEVSELKDTLSVVVRQNQSIMKLIGEQQVTIAKVGSRPTYLHTEGFPIRSQEDLDAMEEKIDDVTAEKLVATVQALISPGGLVKNLCSILSLDICIDYNIDGVHNKKRLQNYPKLLDIMYKATTKSGWTHRMFMDELRRGLKQAKNRHFKNMCVLRKKARESNERLTETNYADVPDLEEPDEDYKDF